MFINSIQIKNYKTFSDSQEIKMNQYTAFIGKNGAGKSAVLSAIKIFFETNYSVSIEDFHYKDTSKPISISITFASLNESETKDYNSYIKNDELMIEKVFPSVGSKGLYYSRSLQNKDFVDLRKATTKTDKRKIFGDIRKTEKYESLPKEKNADEIESILQRWEQENPQSLQLLSSEVQFVGARNIGGGSLDNYTRLVFIPAVKEAISEAIDGKGGALGELLNILVKEMIMQRKEMIELKAKMKEDFKKLTDLTKYEEVPELEGRLTNRLNELVNNTKVHLFTEDPKEPQVILPSTYIEITEDEFRGGINGKGHGLQRAFIISILQELAVVQSQHDEKIRQKQMQTNDSSETLLEDNVQIDKKFRPDLILLIEEPELYQHPARQRHFSEILRDFTYENKENIRVQIVITTHSPYFIDLSNFEDLKITNKITIQDKANTVIKTATKEDVCAKYCSVRNIENPNVSRFIQDSKRIMGYNLNESFFSNAVVLTEGIHDRMAIESVLLSNKFDYNRQNVCIVEVVGKQNLCRIVSILNAFEIKSYSIFDCDSDKVGDERVKNEKENKILFKLFNYDSDTGFPEEPIISENFACFPIKLENSLNKDLSNNNYNFFERRKELSEEFNLDVKHSFVYFKIFEECKAKKIKIEIIEKISEFIITLSKD